MFRMCRLACIAGRQNTESLSSPFPFWQEKNFLLCYGKTTTLYNILFLLSACVKIQERTVQKKEKRVGIGREQYYYYIHTPVSIMYIIPSLYILHYIYLFLLPHKVAIEREKNLLQSRQTIQFLLLLWYKF